MNFSAVPRTSRVGRALRAPLRLLPKQLALPILQGPLRGSRWVVGSGPHGFWLGSYEYAKTRIFASMVTPGGLVVDVGAHAGWYSLLASRCVGPQGRVVAVEPNPTNVMTLRRHLSLNSVRNVEVVEAAAGEANGWASFDPGPEPSVGRISADGLLKVPMVRLDTLLSTKSNTLTVAKIDVEGSEVEVLLGARRLLEDARPTIFLATHGHDENVRCLELLSSFGYVFRALDGRDVWQSAELVCTPKPG